MKGATVKHLLYAALAVSLLGSSAALAQSDVPLNRSPTHPESSARGPADRELPAQPSSANERSDSAAAPDLKRHRLSDPKTGCAAFDINSPPVDAIAWSGSCVGGLADGPGTMTFFNRGKFFQSLTGNFEQGIVRDGQLTAKWADGSRYDGDEVAARMEGSGLLTTAEGDRFQGQWADDRLNGHGLVVWANGDRYEGEWRDGKADGHGVQNWSDGRKYDGEWRNDLPNGHGVVTRKDGSRYEAYFTDGHPRDVTEMAAEAPAGAATAMVAAPVPTTIRANAAETAVANGQNAANSESSARSLNVNDLAGKRLSAIDGSTLALTPGEGGLTREIVAPGGAVKETHFVFLNDKQGTVYEGGDRNNVAGVFRVTDTGVATDYADGRSETLMLNGSSGVSMTQNAPAGDSTCTAWYPEGHVFSDEERKAALAEYARHLGLQGPRDKQPGASLKQGCVVAAAKLAPVPRSRAHAAIPRSRAHGATPVAVAASLVAPSPLGPSQPIKVPTSTVHLIDADALAPDSKTSTSNEPGTVAGGASEASASACLSIESDGRHWGFRNRCAYDVQFAYCLLNADDPLASCREGAVSGSVAANGFGSLIADQGIKETNADHNFRWVACGGGAGEVVVHLDRTNPPAGRCVRPGAS